MSSVSAIKQKVSELIEKSKELYRLGFDLQADDTIRQRLAIEYQRWYREAYTILEENDFSGLDEFEEAYGGPGNNFDYYIRYYDGRSGLYAAD